MQSIEQLQTPDDFRCSKVQAEQQQDHPGALQIRHAGDVYHDAAIQTQALSVNANATLSLPLDHPQSRQSGAHMKASSSLGGNEPEHGSEHIDKDQLYATQLKGGDVSSGYQQPITDDTTVSLSDDVSSESLNGQANQYLPATIAERQARQVVSTLLRLNTASGMVVGEGLNPEQAARIWPEQAVFSPAC